MMIMTSCNRLKWQSIIFSALPDIVCCIFVTWPARVTTDNSTFHHHHHHHRYRRRRRRVVWQAMDVPTSVLRDCRFRARWQTVARPRGKATVELEGGRVESSLPHWPPGPSVRFAQNRREIIQSNKHSHQLVISSWSLSKCTKICTDLIVIFQNFSRVRDLRPP